jgi:hypothetical protein
MSAPKVEPKETATAEYNELLDSIKRTLATGRLRAARAVNNILVET